MQGYCVAEFSASRWMKTPLPQCLASLTDSRGRNQVLSTVPEELLLSA